MNAGFNDVATGYHWPSSVLYVLSTCVSGSVCSVIAPRGLSMPPFDDQGAVVPAGTT